MDLQTALSGMLSAEAKLSERAAIADPSLISREMYRLGQYTSAMEKHLGDAEEAYEREWAKAYTAAKLTQSATAAKQAADIAMAEAKGNIKRLSRYVASGWKVHMSCMARAKHLEQESRGSV